VNFDLSTLTFTLDLLGGQKTKSLCFAVHVFRMHAPICMIFGTLQRHTVLINTVIMTALRSRCGHYIFALWFLLLLSSFFPRLISAIADWMSTILPHMVSP